ncbi:MAG: DUF547 domain-containing protein [Mariprofundus sp.]|nr:DUF547 domain-containing protein [Mariprofundus sp.]
MKKILFLLMIAATSLPGTATAFDHSYKLWNSDLKQFNESGYIHYGAWQRNHARLDRYLHDMQSVTHRKISSWSPAQKEAFWINAHNALVVARILDAYPKVYDLHDKQLLIAGQKVAVEDIRDKILRGTESSVFMLSTALGRKTNMEAGKDLRILFAICEGSKASAPLAATAYTAKRLSKQLEQQVKHSLSDLSFLSVNTRLKTFHVGKFFRTYQRDFKQYKGNALLFERTTGSDRGVLRFIFNYLDKPTQDAVLAKQQRPWRVDYRRSKHDLNGGD